MALGLQKRGHFENGIFQMFPGEAHKWENLDAQVHQYLGLICGRF